MPSSNDPPGDEPAPAENGGEGHGMAEGGDAPDPPPGSGAPPQGTSSPHSGALAWRGAKYFLYGVGGVVLTAVVLAGVLLLLLQTEWGSRVAKELILAQVNPLGEAHLEIDDVDGNWFSGMELKGVRLVRPPLPSDEVPAAGDDPQGTAQGPSARDSVRMVQIDSLEGGYRLLALFNKRVDLSGVQFYGPDVRMAQQADGSWDLAQPFISDDPDTTGTRWRLRLDSVRIAHGTLDMKFYTQSGRDSTLRIRDLNADARDMDFGGPGTPRIDVRSLTARFTPPGQRLERQIALSGALNEHRLAIRHLDLDSPYSNVSGRGTLVLPGAEGGPVRNIDFRLEGRPLSFRDLAGFVPGLDPERSVRFDLHAEGTSKRLQTSFDATFGDGGTASASGTIAPGVGGTPLAYDLEGQVRQFDPGFFTPGPAMGRLNGDFSADLSGTSAQELSGTLRADLFDTRFGEYRFDRTTLAARFSDGTATIDAEGGLRGASFSAEGTVQPFATPLAYDLSGSFQNVNLGRFTDNPQQESDLDGSVSFQGYGTSLADANLTAQLALQPSTINRFRLREGRFTARLIDGKMNLQARVRSPQGDAQADGNIWLTEDPLRYRVREGRLDNVDVAALAGDTTRSQITGTFRLEGRGTRPENLRLDVADLQLRDSYYGPYVINSTNLSGTLAGRRLDLDGQADLNGGTFDLSGATLYPFEAVPSYSVESASFSNVDIGVLGQYPGADVQQSSDLSGTVSLEGRGFQPQTMFLSGTARLTDSRLNRQQINSAVMDLTLEDGLLSYTGTLDVPEGQTRIAGTVRPFAENPTFGVREGTFAGINVGALAGIEGLETDLRGEILSLEGTGFSLETLRGSARVDLTGSTINDATVAGGILDIDTEGDVTNLVANLEFEDGGSTNLDVHLDRSGAVLSYRVTGTVRRLDVGALLSDPAASGLLTARLDVEGEGTDPRTASIRGEIDADRARLGDIDASHLALDFNLSDGLLVVDTLAVRSNVADATGGGVLSLYDAEGRYASNFQFTASVDSLGPVRPFLNDSLRALAVGENDIQGRFTGQPGGPLRLEADVRLERLVYNDLRLSQFDGVVSATTAPATDTTGAGGLLAALDELSVEALRNAQVRGDAGYLATSGFSTRQASFDAIYDGNQVDLEARVQVDEERDIELAGILDPRPDQQRLRLDTLNVRFGPDRWKLLQDATITYGEQYRISSLLLFTEDGQQVAVDGVIDFDGEQSLVFTLENFRIGAVADLLGYEDLGGTASGTLSLSGPAPSPQLTGSLNLDVESGGETVGDLQLALDYANERLGIDARLLHEDQSALTAEGYLPLDLRLTEPAALADVSADSLALADSVRVGEEDSPVDIVDVSADTVGTGEVALAVQADSFAVEWIRPFLDPEQVEALSGRLTADIDVGGTLGAPRMEGTVALTGGTLRLVELGTTYENIRAQARLTGDQVQLREAVLESGDGRLTARGTVNLQALTLGELDIAINAENFRTVDTDAYRATASADLQLTGTTEAPVVRGDVNVRDADVYLDAFGAEGEYGDVALTEEDLRELRENFGVNITEADTSRLDVYQALAMQLNVEIERDTWLRSTSNPELAVQLEGDLDLQKAAQEDLQLFGSIEVVPERSRVVQFGKRFDIASGVITFNGNPAEPSLDLDAEYNVAARRSRGDEVTITLSVSGRPDDLNFELGSNPSMETTDILSYIATGRPASESFVGGGTGGAEQLATGVALGQITGFIEGLAGTQGLGLDIVEIEQDPQRGTVLTAGEYLYVPGVPNPLFVAVSQPLASTAAGAPTEADETEVTLEYEVTDGLLVRLLRRESIRLNLRFEYAY